MRSLRRALALLFDSHWPLRSVPAIRDPTSYNDEFPKVARIRSMFRLHARHRTSSQTPYFARYYVVYFIGGFINSSME
jgi:hypothetical protein